MTEVVLDSVNKVYPGGHTAVHDLSLRVADGELFVLLGPSGCGKSTILRMIAGLEDITSGELWLDGEIANDLQPRDRDLAMVFQNGALYPHRTVRGNLSFPLELAGGGGAAIQNRIVELSRALAIDETLNRMPATLSGGQRQRVAMGRALIREPKVFLMDEPLSNLDAALRTELRVEIAALVRSLRITTLYVTHDQVEALTLADRIAVLRKGVLQDVGTPQQVYDDPATVFVAAFLSSPNINLLQATAWATQEEGIVLDFGAQRLHLPWADPRTPGLVGHHGSTVTVGVRADALRLMDGDRPGDVLSGRLRHLEYHGHEWMAYAEAGIPTTDVDGPGEPTDGEQPLSTDRPLRDRLRRLLRGAEEATVEPPPADPSTHGGTHRRADIVFRVGSGSGLRRGDKVHLAVDMDRILLFGADGRRVDPITR